MMTVGTMRYLFQLITYCDVYSLNATHQTRKRLCPLFYFIDNTLSRTVSAENVLAWHDAKAVVRN